MGYGLEGTESREVNENTESSYEPPREAEENFDNPALFEIGNTENTEGSQEDIGDFDDLTQFELGEDDSVEPNSGQYMSAEVSENNGADTEIPVTRDEIRDTVKDVYAGMFDTENISDDIADIYTEETDTRQAEKIISEGADTEVEKSPEKLSERFDKLKGRDIHELSEEEKTELVSISVDNIISKYGDKLTPERIEKIKNSVSFVDTREVEQDGVRDADKVLGYYNPDTDSIKINTDAEKDTRDIIATIDHECMHMLTQEVDADGVPNGVTGVKSRDMYYGNVGMNEGITEMYSIRNMSEINPDYVSHSYTAQVEIMQKYESICGEDLMREAYTENNLSLLENDFDAVMGEGQFRVFCDNMDLMHISEANEKYKLMEYYKSEADAMLDKYRSGKENIENEQLHQ